MNINYSPQKGGDYVGQGSSGCGFFPGFRCKGETKRDKDIFTKLMTTEAATHELDVVKHIRKIDPDMKYSIYPYKICYPSEKDLDELMQEGLPKCSISGIKLDNPMIMKMAFEKKMIAMLQQKYGGKSLESIVQSALYTKLSSNIIYQIFYRLLNVFKGLELYHENDTVHFDIKTDNLVMSDTSYFIDFGLSMDLKVYVPGNKYYDSEFPFYSQKLYEIYPLNSIYIKKWNKLFNENGAMTINKDAVRNYWTTIKSKPYIPVQLYMGEFYDDTFIPFSDEREYYEMYENIFANILELNDGNKKILKPSIRNYLFKQIDVHSLGFTLCKLTYALTKKILNIDGKVVKAKEYGAASAIPDNIVEDLYVLGMKMMHPDPMMRPTIHAATKIYTAILKKMPIQVSVKSPNKLIETVENSPEGMDPYLILQSLLEI